MISKTCSLLCVCFFISYTASAQLGQIIGVNEAPNPQAPICSIPFYLGLFSETGYNEGDIVNDFSFFNPEGDRFRLADLLDEKPVLVIAGSYTCWRFRQQMAEINAVTNYYEEDLSVFIVYTVEAHPTDISPYSGTIWTGEPNFAEDILYSQPTTYAERLSIISDMRDEMAIVPEILVDDPCNQWWLNFGPAPNNAYLINTDGEVAFKHDWANNLPDDLWCDLDEFFHQESDFCNDADYNGSFSVELNSESETVVYGTAGEVLTISSTIQNLSQTDNVTIDIERESVYVPDFWTTALCIDVCYNSSVSNASVTIPPGGEQEFIFYFYTGPEEGTGSAQVRFENANVEGNYDLIEYTAVTGTPTDVDEEDVKNFSLFPNPAADFVNLNIPESYIGQTVSLYDASGRIVLQHSLNTTSDRLDVSSIPVGMYFVRLGQTDEFRQKLVVR